jgi:uncharacterized protein YfaQ (DUF2300 family)
MGPTSISELTFLPDCQVSLPAIRLPQRYAIRITEKTAAHTIAKNLVSSYLSFTKKKEVFMLSTDKSWKPSVNFA